MRLLLFSTLAVSVNLLLSAQDVGRGGQLAGRGPAPPAMTLTIPGFPDGGQIPLSSVRPLPA